MIGREEDPRTANVESFPVAGQDLCSLIERFVTQFTLDWKSARTSTFCRRQIWSLDPPAEHKYTFGHDQKLRSLELHELTISTIDGKPNFLFARRIRRLSPSFPKPLQPFPKLLLRTPLGRVIERTTGKRFRHAIHIGECIGFNMSVLVSL